NAIRQENQDILGEASVIYGMAFLSFGESNRAQKLFDVAQTLRPENLVAHRGLAALYYDQGIMDFATRQPERWIAIDPTDGRPYRFLGQIGNEMEEPRAAIEHYQAALARSLAAPVREQARVELAELQIGQQAFASALEALDSGPWETVEPGMVTLLRAECLYGLCRRTEAARSLDE